ncbi:MAG: ATP-independent RNA helicase DbpA [Gammaproteobacteria bacterium]|jgi:ATP-independent RNA helicase DbpA
MTPIQAKALPHALAGRDLIAQAKTGSGKTAAFGLALINQLNPRFFGSQALILCPTRELATQVAKELRRLARYQQNIKVVTLCGGQSIGPQIGSLEHGAHIIVGTPGRITDHLRKKTLSIDSINTLVLDEADRMLAMGFIDDIESIIDQTPKDRQTLLFSATYPDDISDLSARFQRDPLKVSVESIHSDDHIDQMFYICDRKRKHENLVQLLTHYDHVSAVVFCNTKQETKDVSRYLDDCGFYSLALHGDLEQRDRDQILIRFKQQSCRILVATDVAARGLDIDDLPAVINYDLPRDPETYVHRIGRTGRAGKKGFAISLLSESEGYKLDAIGAYQNLDTKCEKISSLPETNRSIAPPTFVTLSIGGGRKDKVRPGDILGALTGDAGIDSSAVGNIEIMDYAAYVAIDRKQADKALGRLLNGKIKGRKFKVRKL